MICVKCGFSIAEGMKFCTSCGAVAKRGETFGTEKMAQHQYKNPLPEVRKAPFSVALVVSALVVALIAVGAAGYFFVMPVISDANNLVADAGHSPDDRDRGATASREDDEYYETNDEPDDEVLQDEDPPIESWMVALEDLLSQMTTIFEPPAWAEETWIDGSWTRTGRFGLGWDENWVAIITYETPELYFVWNGGGFFDAFGNRIHDAPWLISWHGSGWSSYNYAATFRLFDFGNNGVPDLFIHFAQTFEGGYGGATRMYRYMGGSFRQLEVQGWISSLHQFFVDDHGTVIAFMNNSYFGEYSYQQLIFDNHRLEMQTIVELSDLGWDLWEEWQNFHWTDWGQDAEGNWGAQDGWMFHNPTIMGTDIRITMLEPLTALQEEVTANMKNR